MTTKTIREIALAWKSDKQRYVKQSTYAAYVLILENHILPSHIRVLLVFFVSGSAFIPLYYKKKQ